MIETYAFLGMFAVQILAMSVLHPALLTRYVRVQASRLPAERLARFYPGVDLKLATERFLRHYRLANAAIVAIGLLLLGWLVDYMLGSAWDESAVIAALSAYFMLQLAPLVVISWLGFRLKKTHKPSLLDAKRTAVLERRGLWDFVSPVAVFAALAGYVLFVAYVLYLQPEPNPGFALIGVLTLAYALQAITLYRMLYGKKTNPLDTHASRLHTMGVAVRINVYLCIVLVVFFALTFTLDFLDLKRWMPFAQSVFLVIFSLLCVKGLTVPPRDDEADGLSSTAAR